MGLARRAGVTRDAEHVYAVVTGNDDTGRRTERVRTVAATSDCTSLEAVREAGSEAQTMTGDRIPAHVGSSLFLVSPCPQTSPRPNDASPAKTTSVSPPISPTSSHTTASLP